MSDIFIAHVEEDADVALEIALGLEEGGYATWCYEVDSIPGPSYLIQTGRAVEQAKAVVVVITPNSVGSRQVTKEIVRAHESGKEFIPVLRGITHVEFQNRQPEWREALGAASSISIPSRGVVAILPRIISGLKVLGIQPKSERNTTRIVQIRKALDELQGRATLEKAGELPPPIRKPEVKPAVTERPPAKVAAEARGQQKWIRLAVIACVVIALSVVGVIFLGRSQPAPPLPPTSPSPPAEGVTPAPTTLVAFPDENLRHAVKQALHSPPGEPITAEELTRLGGLDANQRGIVDLTGIEHCVNLTKLGLARNHISDISALSFLTKLTDLELGENQISDISALSPLSNLTALYLWENQVSDIQALSSLTNLTELGLGGNPISDISALSSLTNLTKLYLCGQISDVSALSSLTNLTVLCLGGNQISDISALSSLTRLTELELGENQISDISALSPLTNLTVLQLWENQVSDIQALSSLTKLTFLYLWANRISDISPLSSLTNLTELNLEGNQIRDIRPLLANTGLSEGDIVTLRYNPLSPTMMEVYIPQLEQRGVTVILEE